MFIGGNASGQKYLDEIIELNHLHWNNRVYSETAEHIWIIEVLKGKKSKGRFKYTKWQEGEKWCRETRKGTVN